MLEEKGSEMVEESLGSETVEVCSLCVCLFSWSQSATCASLRRRRLVACVGRTTCADRAACARAPDALWRALDL